MTAAQDRSYRVLVTGSRDWLDKLELRLAIIDAAAVRMESGLVIVHGACPSGADAMAAEWAADYKVPAEPHPADWARFGKSAGFRRNAEMVALGADVCLAFIRNSSRGAAHCADLAEKAGIRTLRFTTAGEAS